MKMSESSRDKDKKPYDNNNLTMWEDSSKQAILAMGNIGDGLGEITGATEKAGEEINNSVGTNLETVMRRLKDSLADMGKALLPAVESVTEGIEDLTKFISKLNPEVVKSIAKFGAMALAFGAVTKVTGTLVTGMAKGVSGLSKIIKVMDKVKSVGGFAKALGAATSSTGGLVSALGTLSSVALPLVAVIGSVAAGIYAFHEYNDALTQSVTKSREEMSALEKVFADLTGTTTYSKKELEKMGIVYEDFNEDISPEFQKAVESMRDKIHEFNMDLALFSADNVWSDEETEQLKNNFNTAVDESIKNIENRRDEVQKMWAETFVMGDGVIDEGEQKVIEYYNTQYNSSIDEVNKMKADVNELFRKMIEEGYTLTPEDEQMIREYFSKINEIELECLAGNEEEQLFAKNKFKSQVNGLDAEGASKLGKERKKELDNELTDIEAFYDTKIELLKKDIENTDGETRKAFESQLAELENQKNQKVNAKKEEINAIYDEIVAGNENLKGVIDRFNLEVFSGEDKRSNDKLNKLKKENADMLSETETGMKKIYDTQLKGWKEVTTIVDESTGEITGVISTWVDDEGMHMEKAEGYNEELSESTKTLGENMVTEFNRMKSSIEQNSECYVDNSGKIVNANGQVIGSISQVIDENGNLVTSVNDVNGNPIDIKDNTGEAINNLDNTARKVKELDGKTATVKVTLDKGNVESQINWIARDREVRIKATGMGTFIKPEFTPKETGGSVNESGIYNTQEAGLELIDTASPSQSAYSLTKAARGELTYIPANSKVTNAAMTSLKMESMIDKKLESAMNIQMNQLRKEIVAIMKNNFNNGNGNFNVTMNNPNFVDKGSENANINNIKRIISSMK